MQLLKPNIFILFFLILLASGCQDSRSTQENFGSEELEDPSIQFSKELIFLETASKRSLPTEEIEQKQELIENIVNIPRINPLEVEGDIEISGNYDINPLNDLIYKEFVKQGYSGIVSLSGIQSSDAIKDFCKEGKFDILTVSRPMNDEELEACQSNERQPIDFPIAHNALVFVVNRKDTFVKNITLSRLEKIFQAEKWSDINSNWPDEIIERFLIIPNTLLFDLFPEKLSREKDETVINILNTNSYKFYQPLTQELSATRYGIGYVSYPYFQRNSEFLRVIPIEGYVANTENVQNQIYPFGNNLYLYADLNQLSQKPQVSSFINFYLNTVNQKINQVGYLPLSEEELNKSRVTWLEAMGINN